MHMQPGITGRVLVGAIVGFSFVSGLATVFAQSTSEFVPVTDAMLQEPSPDEGDEEKAAPAEPAAAAAAAAAGEEEE